MSICEYSCAHSLVFIVFMSFRAHVNGMTLLNCHLYELLVFHVWHIEHMIVFAC